MALFGRSRQHFGQGNGQGFLMPFFLDNPLILLRLRARSLSMTLRRRSHGGVRSRPSLTGSELRRGSGYSEQSKLRFARRMNANAALSAHRSSPFISRSRALRRETILSKPGGSTSNIPFLIICPKSAWSAPSNGPSGASRNSPARHAS